jgi:hypothetical protein
MNRPPLAYSKDAAQVRAMKAQGLGASEIAKLSRWAGRRSIGCWKPADRRAAGGSPRGLPTHRTAIRYRSKFRRRWSRRSAAVF